MRGYTVATAAVALRVSAKWVDNTLSHYRVAGVHQSRQGIARRLTAESVLVLEIALRLVRLLQIPLRSALVISRSVTADEASTYAADECRLRIDVESIRATVDRRLAEAVEFAPAPRRGRPPVRAGQKK